MDLREPAVKSKSRRGCLLFLGASGYDARVVAAVLSIALASGAPRPLVDAVRVVPGLRLDIRYATARNITGRPLYAAGRCLLLPETAAALARVQARLVRSRRRLLVWDCYRPPSAQRALWKIFPHPGWVADPRTGSNHERGTAVDLTLADASGRPLLMPTDFDSFDPRARQGATRGIPREALENRERLRAAMRAEGFITIRKEWWHYDLPGARSHPILDVPL